MNRPLTFGHSPGDILTFEAEDEAIGILVALVHALRPAYVLETGTYHGKTAMALGQALQQNGDGWLHTIELDPSAPRSLTRLPITFHRCDSLTFTPSAPIDLAFFDSGTGTTRQDELNRFRPFMGPLAIAIVHDDTECLSEIPSGWTGIRLGTPKGLAILQPAR